MIEDEAHEMVIEIQNDLDDQQIEIHE